MDGANDTQEAASQQPLARRASRHLDSVDALSQHIRHISSIEPAPALVSDQNPDVQVQLIQPGVEELKTPRAHDINAAHEVGSDSTLSPAVAADYFSATASASVSASPPLHRRQSIQVATLSPLPGRPTDSPELIADGAPSRGKSVLTRDLTAQREAAAAAPVPDAPALPPTSPDEVLASMRLRPQRSLSEYPAQQHRRSPELGPVPSTSESPQRRSRPAGLTSLRGASLERQSRTAGNTPLQTPHLYSPRASRPPTGLLHGHGAFASPYLHPVQPQVPKETSKVIRDVDTTSGRKTINQYEIQHEIGKGTHGKVKLARSLDTGEFVAIKIVQRYSKKKRLGRASNSREDQVKREIAILKKAVHNNVVSMLEVIDDPDMHKIYLVLEFCELHDVKWRTPGESEILLIEQRRLEREARGDTALDVPAETDRIMEAAMRRAERMPKPRKAPLSRINSQDEFCWSLEFAQESEDEDDIQPSESASAAISRISTQPSIRDQTPPIDGSHSTSEEGMSPTDVRHIHRPEQDIHGDVPDLQQIETPDQPQSWDVRDLLQSHLHRRFEHLDHSNEHRERKASVAESSASHLTEMMEDEIDDAERRYVPLITIDETRQAFRDALLGLEYLHYQGIVHRDLKPENLLRKADHSVKISDFGVSYLGKPQRDGRESEDVSESESADHEEEAELAKTVGTPAFYAPELCSLEFTSEKPRVTPQIDVWALGVVLYCLVYARLPFSASNEFVMMRNIVEDTVFFSRKRLKAIDLSARAGSRFFKSQAHRLPHELAYEDVDDDLMDLLKRLFQKDPTKRIQVKEIKHHPWILRDIVNPLAWQEETDPARFTQGKKIEISTAEVAEAVIPLKLIARAKSVAKKVGGVLGLGTGRTTRKRGQSSANSSEMGSTTSSGPSVPSGSTAGRRRESFTSEEGLSGHKGIREPIPHHPGQHQEHPLSQSVTASPDLAKADRSFDETFASHVPEGMSEPKRPPLAGRQESALSTAASIRTVRQSDIHGSHNIRTATSPDEIHHSHRDILSTTSLGAIFGGAGRSIMRTMSRSRRGSESRASSTPPSPRTAEATGHAAPHAQSHPPVHPHGAQGEPSTAISNASAAGLVQQPPKTSEPRSCESASPSPHQSKRTSLIGTGGGVSAAGLSHAINEATFARHASPITSSPASRASPAPAEPTADVSEAEYNEVRQQLARRRVLDETRAAESSRPTSAPSSQPCPPSPDDEVFPARSTDISPQSSGFLPLSPLHSPSPKPRQQSIKPISSNSSEDRFTSGISQSTSYPSIPSAMSVNSSVMPDEDASESLKDDSEGTAGAEWEQISQGPMATPRGPLVLTEARKQELDRASGSAVPEDDEEDSNSDDGILVMNRPKSRVSAASKPRRPSTHTSSRRQSYKREGRSSHTRSPALGEHPTSPQQS